jgi:hypothetical protein
MIAMILDALMLFAGYRSFGLCCSLTAVFEQFKGEL